ncbi:MAG: type III secretion system export apparatus subunit SctT [Pseudomonadota bacterium]|nr:type III secretion system export apparatus subunit SctT [Pseudomonadota bacterium]
MIAPATIGTSLIQSIPWMEQALLVGAGSARFGFAFMMLPFFAPQQIPPLVRNSLIVTFGLVALSLPIGFDPQSLSASQWVLLLGKEAAAGAILGLFFSTFLWAMASAGELIDTKTGATIAQIVDPVSGSTQSLSATFLGRFAQVTFISAGGFTLLVGSLMLSYAIWPMGPGGLELNLDAVRLFEGELGRFFQIAFFIASPVLMVLFIIDLGMGVLNRFAPNFNVFMLSLSIKTLSAIFLLFLLLPLLTQMVIADLTTRQDVGFGIMERVGEPR